MGDFNRVPTNKHTLDLESLVSLDMGLECFSFAGSLDAEVFVFACPRSPSSRDEVFLFDWARWPGSRDNEVFDWARPPGSRDDEVFVFDWARPPGFGGVIPP